jgi:hypothetical protein
VSSELQDSCFSAPKSPHEEWTWCHRKNVSLISRSKVTQYGWFQKTVALPASIFEGTLVHEFLHSEKCGSGDQRRQTVSTFSHFSLLKSFILPRFQCICTMLLLQQQLPACSYAILLHCDVAVHLLQVVFLRCCSRADARLAAAIADSSGGSSSAAFIEHIAQETPCVTHIRVCCRALCTAAQQQQLLYNNRPHSTAHTSRQTKSGGTDTAKTTSSTTAGSGNSSSLAIEKTDMSREQQLQLRDEVKEMFDHAYTGYMQHAFPHGELKPISCSGVNFELSQLPLMTLIGKCSDMSVAFSAILYRSSQCSDL